MTRGRGGPLRGVPVVPAVALAGALLGCAHLPGAGGDRPSGLPDWDDRLRTLLAEGSADRALELVTPENARAGDELLRLQHEGLVAHYAGDWDRSSDALERAVRLTEDRYTKSVSKAVLSMLASDRVLDYYPPPPERLLLHYYGALNYLRRDEPDEAAVEARRLGRLLERAAEDGDLPARPGLGRALSHFAGAVFEAAGQRNDADVAYRRARAYGGAAGETAEDTAATGEAGRAVPGDGSSPGPAAGDAPETRPGEDPAGPAGEVLVVVERGFVAHKVEEGLTVFLPPGDVRTLREVGRRASDGDGEDAGEAVEIAERVIAGELGTEPGTSAPRRSRTEDGRRRGARPLRGDEADGDDGRDPVLLRIAWPVFRESARPRGASRILVDGDTAAVEPVARIDVSGAVRAAYAERRTLDLAKTLVRAATKTALAEGIEDAVSEEDETLGEVAGWTARVAGVLLERADTRSWHLLPARVELHRLRLPAGTHRLEAVVPGDEVGSGRDAGAVEVEPGGVAVVALREWG